MMNEAMKSRMRSTMGGGLWSMPRASTRGEGGSGVLVSSRVGRLTQGRSRHGVANTVAHAALLAVLTGMGIAVGLCGLAAPAHAAVSCVKIDGKTLYSSAKGAKLQQVKGCSYNAAKGVLTLNGVKLTTKAQEAVRITASPKDTVKVKLKGTNVITAGKAHVSGIQAGCQLQLYGTNLTLNNMSTAVAARSVVIKDGTYAFKRCASVGIAGFDSVKLPADSIGAVSVTMLHPTKSAAIVAALGKVSNAPERLGTIAGRLGFGATFQHANSLYTVVGNEKVKLMRYSGGKEADLEAVTYGKCGYDIVHIGTNAFNNRIGKKVTKITIGSNTRVIEQDAFKGTSLLTSMDLKHFLNNVNIRNWRAMLNTVVKGIDRKAFRGCGMLGGARLTVHTSFENADVNIAIKGAMTIKGMPLLAKFRK